MSQHHEPQRVPLPDNFPVSWDPPEWEHLPWMQDKMHGPAPITPLTGWIAEGPWSAGSSTGIQSTGQPLIMQCGRFNSYHYLAVAPSVPPEQMEERGPIAEQKLDESIASFSHRWENEWLPEVKAGLKAWEEFLLEAVSDAEILTHVEDSIQLYQRF
jgi:hypothetical protein